MSRCRDSIPTQWTKKSSAEYRREQNTRIETLAGGAAFSIRQDLTDAKENDGREGEVIVERREIRITAARGERPAKG